MNVQSHTMLRNSRYGASVRDILVAKAIQNGYNPYCKSTDRNARVVTEEMRANARLVCVPETRTTLKADNRPVVREVKKLVEKKRETRPHREVISLENFEFVEKRSAPLSLGMIVSVMVTAVVLATIVFSGSLINQEARRNSELTEQIAVLQKENDTLALSLEEKNNLEVIEEIAENELGMIKVASAEQHYISLSEGNAVNVYENKEEDNEVTFNLLNIFGEKISSFLEYLD